MKSSFLKYLLFALMLFPMQLFGQGKVYTRTMRLADFPQKTTKIVLSGQSVLDDILKEEITSRWRISPFEFCDYSEYKALEHGKLYYFLHLASDSDFTYMILTKGGPVGGNPLSSGFDIVSIPIAGAGEPSSEELLFLPAFIDIVQEYLLRAMVSEAVSYKGLRGIIHRRPRGSRVCTDTEEGRRLFAAGAEDNIVPVIIRSSGNGRRHLYYKMLISTDNHLLYEFKRRRI